LVTPKSILLLVSVEAGAEQTNSWWSKWPEMPGIHSTSIIGRRSKQHSRSIDLWSDVLLHLNAGSSGMVRGCFCLLHPGVNTLWLYSVRCTVVCSAVIQSSFQIRFCL